MKVFRVLLLGVVLVCIATTQAWAFPVSVGDEVYFNYALGSGTSPGGPFSVYDSGTGSKLFDTFCLERNEYIHLGSQNKYFVSGIDEYAAKGGIGGATNQKDYLSSATKWLFWQFVAGNLDDYVAGYTYNTVWSTALQQAFWYLEDEVTSVTGKACSLAQLANLHQGDSIGGSVMVMNIFDMNNQYAQSQLLATPTPEPGTLILLGSGIAVLAGLRRRKK